MTKMQCLNSVIQIWSILLKITKKTQEYVCVYLSLYIYLYIICIYVYVCMLVAQSCPTLCDPRDGSPLGSSVHGILQARVLEWVAIPSPYNSNSCPLSW